MTSMTSDNGREWVNRIIANLCHNHNIHQILTTPYYPQGNAIGERQHRELHDFLRAMLKDTNKWPELLNYAAMAHNTQFNETIGHSPYYTVFFREHPGLFSKLMPPEKRLKWSSDDVSHMLHARFLTRQAIEKATEKQRRYYDRKAKLQQYRPGDLVLRWNEKAGNLINRKLLHSWTGPYIVVDAPTTGNTVQISTPIGENKVWVNKNKLKFYFSSQRLPTPETTKPTNNDRPQPIDDEDYNPVLLHYDTPDDDSLQPSDDSESTTEHSDDEGMLSSDHEYHPGTPTPTSSRSTTPTSPAPETETNSEAETETPDNNEPDPYEDSPAHNLRDRDKLQRPERYRWGMEPLSLSTYQQHFLPSPSPWVYKGCNRDYVPSPSQAS